MVHNLKQLFRPEFQVVCGITYHNLSRPKDAFNFKIILERNFCQKPLENKPNNIFAPSIRLAFFLRMKLYVYRAAVIENRRVKSAQNNENKLTSYIYKTLYFYVLHNEWLNMLNIYLSRNLPRRICLCTK